MSENAKCVCPSVKSRRGGFIRLSIGKSCPAYPHEGTYEEGEA